MFVRTCYKVLLGLIDQKQAHPFFGNTYYAPIIYGTPGIGKSYFGYHLLLSLAKKHATVVYYDGTAKRAYLFSDSQVSFGPLSLYESLLRNPEIYFVVDSAEALVVEAKTILITSPLKSHWKHLDKEKGNFFPMPIWSEQEIFECRALVYQNVDQDTAKANFLRWGGVPRYVLRFGNDAEKQRQLDEAIATCSPSDLSKFAGTEFAKDDICHRLVHIVPKEGFVGGWAHHFASSYVASKVSEHLHQSNRTALEQFLASSQGIAPLAALRGYLLESYTHRRLATGGGFRIRNLETGVESTKNLEKLEVIEFSEDVPNPVAGKYYVPRNSNFESIDSYCEKCRSKRYIWKENKRQRREQ